MVGPGAAIPPEFKRAGIPDVMSNGQPPSLEGFLFPRRTTQAGITPFELRDEMLAAFNRNVTDAMLQQRQHRTSRCTKS